MEWPAQKITKKKVSSLKPYDRNARTHSDEQVEQIAASMAGKGDWRFCVENDCYVATEHGEIYRVCRRQRSKSGRIVEKYSTAKMRGSVDKYGYRTYRMRVSGKRKSVKGHRLVLNAFVGERPDMVANHMDGNKKNNSLNNLEWVTVAENNRHAIETGLFDPKRPKWKNAKIRRYDYATIHALHRMFNVRRAEIAREFGVSRQTIDNVIRAVDSVMLEMSALRRGV